MHPEHLEMALEASKFGSSGNGSPAPLGRDHRYLKATYLPTSSERHMRGITGMTGQRADKTDHQAPRDHARIHRCVAIKAALL